MTPFQDFSPLAPTRVHPFGTRGRGHKIQSGIGRSNGEGICLNGIRIKNNS